MAELVAVGRTPAVRDGVRLDEACEGALELSSEAFVNRELSWLEFNRRVLEEAQDPTVPLLERVKFLSIFSSNLDEFFMVRVAMLKRHIRAGDQTASPDGLTPAATLAAVTARVHELVEIQHRCFLDDIRPLLAAEGILLLRPKELSEDQRRFLERHFLRAVLPVLTPLAVDPAHSFPYLGNRSLCLVVSIRPSAPSRLPHTRLSVIHLPGQPLPRFVALPDPDGRHVFMLLEDVIRLHLRTIYTGYDVLSSHAIRITRDADLQPPGDPEDLLASIEESLRERRLGAAVRLQHDGDLPSDILATLLDELEMQPEDRYEHKGFAAFSDLLQLYAALDLPRLKDRARPPHPVTPFAAAPDIWSAVRARDILVQHPYHTFDAVTRFVHEAAVDPKVLAIKMTLYRVSPASPIAHALHTAVENGKEVAVLVELQARFDEEANIRWARALEEVGAHVVYGLPGFKTHCKACLVVRQESDGIRRYCHLATGNYNARTAGVYSDLGLFTSRESFGEDLTQLFNLLTGYTRPTSFHHLLLAPGGLRDGLVDRIRREAGHARAGRPARIIAKMNGLVDRRLIEELYVAGATGVRIDLIVRGICCLRPEVGGLSENIRVVSIVDRYLEHARIFHFENAGDPEYLLASADWMPRNLDRRVEIAFPVLDPVLQAQIREILEIQLADTVKARRILANGSSVRTPATHAPALRSQDWLYQAAAHRAAAT
jgi:polyphosphate kinase